MRPAEAIAMFDKQHVVHVHTPSPELSVEVKIFVQTLSDLVSHVSVTFRACLLQIMTDWQAYSEQERSDASNGLPRRTTKYRALERTLYRIELMKGCIV